MKELTTDLKTLKNVVKIFSKSELEANIDELRRLQTEIIDFMNKVPCAGIAAPQFGENYPVFGLNDKKEVVFSPTIKKYGKNLVNNIEGCLSFPKINTITERSSSIDASYFVLEGDNFKLVNTKIMNFPAIVFQHETDHIYGNLMMDRSVTHFASQFTQSNTQKLFQINSDDFGYDYFLENENVLFFGEKQIDPKDYPNCKIAGVKNE